MNINAMLLNLFGLFLFFGVILTIFIMLMIYIFRNIPYEKSQYKSLVNTPKKKVFFDKGLWGEFLTVNALEGMAPEEKFLVNVYLPKNKKGETTEIDVIYLNTNGIFILESKNFSGWIFGDEKSKYWMQTLNKGTKNKFYNPILQNNGHMEALHRTLHRDYRATFKSIIVFSERCQLKKISVTSKNTYVVKRNALRNLVKQISTPLLSKEDIDYIYESLLPYCKVSEEIKLKHIADIKRSSAPQNTKIPSPTVTTVSQPSTTIVTSSTPEAPWEIFAREKINQITNTPETPPEIQPESTQTRENQW